MVNEFLPCDGVRHSPVPDIVPDTRVAEIDTIEIVPLVTAQLLSKNVPSDVLLNITVAVLHPDRQFGMI
jgi:hypothetical protein